MRTYRQARAHTHICPLITQRGKQTEEDREKGKYNTLHMKKEIKERLNINRLT